MASIKDIYPPIVDTFQPAFVDKCVVHFALSSYNSVSVKNYKMNYVVKDRNTNNELLVDTVEIKEDKSTTRADRFSIEIPVNSNIKESEYYNVQLRYQPKENVEEYSEWSTVTIITKVPSPVLELRGFNENKSNQSISELVSIIGTLKQGKEKLYSYRIQILNNNEEKVWDSDIQYPDSYAPNELNYSVDYALEESKRYTIRVSYTTENNYSDSKDYSVYIASDYFEGIKGVEIAATAHPEEGCIEVQIDTAEHFLGNYTIRRASEKTNFTVWEDIYTSTVKESYYGSSGGHANKFFSIAIKDRTVESGILYRYGIQKRSSYGNRGKFEYQKDSISVLLDDIFLSSGNLTFKVKYNPTVNSFKRNVLEGKVDPIGSKYPFVRRNGNINYRTFPIGALISMQADENGMIFSDEDRTVFFNQRENNLNGETLSAMNEAKSTKPRINPYNDFISERKFREAVMDFLYNNTVKLFRSTPEGNMLVKLMDINFTPNAQVGRMIYSFTATAVEIDECTVANYDKYDIQKVGTYSDKIEEVTKNFSQITIRANKNENILNSSDIQDRYINNANKGYIKTINGLTWLKLEMQEEPYLIDVSDRTNPIPLKDSNNTSGNRFYGYILKINDTPILIPPHGKYELEDGDDKIKSISTPVPMTLIMDYEIETTTQEDKTQIARNIEYTMVAGQLFGGYNLGDNLIASIVNKYTLNYSGEYFKTVDQIEEITIEGEPNMVFYINDPSDGNTKDTHILGASGVLEIKDVGKFTSDNFLSFEGFELQEENKTEYYDSNKYTLLDNGDTYVENGVFKDNNGVSYIFFRGETCPFKDNRVKPKKAELLINYVCRVKKGEY